MKKTKKKIPVKTLILAAAAILLFASGGIMGARAQLGVFSEDMNAQFSMDELQVELLENGVPPAEGVLLSGIEKAAPGKLYEERITAQNTSGHDEFVRIIVRKYWTDPSGAKITALDPAFIHLTYKDRGYNSENWQINRRESTEEMSVYYCKSRLGAGDTAADLFDGLRIDKETAKKKDVRRDGNTITYSYLYDGFRCNVKAEAQAIQTHNAQDALLSLWGVRNVRAEGSSLEVTE